MAGSNIAITATASNNWHFSGWSGDTNGCTQVGNVITAAMTQARAITATFGIDQKTLTVASAYGGTYPGTLTTNHNTVLSQWVTNSPMAGGVNTQYVCAGWVMTGNEPLSGTTTNLTLMLTNNATLVWLWQTNYWLDITNNGPGSVHPASGWLANGLSTNAAAQPSNYYHLAIWTGTVNSTNNPLPLIMDQAHFLVARFAENLATHGTPEWWMALHALTNDTFALEEIKDTDGDGMPAWQEYVVNTDPTNRESVLAIFAIMPEADDNRVAWKGGQWVTQYLESCSDFGSTDPTWVSIFTNSALPTPITNLFVDYSLTNALRFYRIKATK